MFARRVMAIGIAVLLCWPAGAWDYERHRLVNALALASLPKDFPAFARTAKAKERIMFLGGEPDRWRNQRDRALRHFNNPDHYFDIEYLVPYRIAPKTISHFRYEFVGRMAAARVALKLPPTTGNPDRLQGHPGFLPWTINEHYLKLVSAFSYLKVFEEMGTEEEVTNARANVIYRMGLLSHFVGDASQPLHTTKHFNGWTGDNPKGFTTSRRFHSWIDGGFFNATTDPTETGLRARLRAARRLTRPPAREDASGQFQAILAYIITQNLQVEPLYQMDKSGKLSPKTPREGQAFLHAQLLRGSQMLGDLWLTAWQEAQPDTFLRGYLNRRKLESPKK
ncbi:MAG: hypothetical protein VX705_11050 [Verrucomicrobiota bacterium]|nr:hypothetical protein [Verrucomicrobiota bacterium]